MRGHGCVAIVTAVLLSACAHDPQAEQQASYERYWRCTYAAAMRYRDSATLTPREAAMRGQAACYPQYVDYRDRRIRDARSAAGHDREMAGRLGEQAAFERRKLVTRRLTELVRDARAD